jgi:general secretion pathway protein G
MNFKNKGFTLVELLVVISIIGLLASIVLAATSSASKKARDGRRLAEVHQIQIALELYKSTNGTYPDSDYNGCGGWSVGNQSQPMINGALNPTYMSQAPRDPSATGNCAGYFYYHYTSGWLYCGDKSFYILEIRGMETVSGQMPSNPGFKCPERDWSYDGNYVTGAFE